MASDKTEILNQRIASLDFFVEVGSLELVSDRIRATKRLSEELGRTDLSEKIASYEQWIEEAKSFETVHGAGSMLNEDHPRLIAVRAREKAFRARHGCSSIARVSIEQW